MSEEIKKTVSCIKCSILHTSKYHCTKCKKNICENCVHEYACLICKYIYCCQITTLPVKSRYMDTDLTCNNCIIICDCSLSYNSGYHENGPNYPLECKLCKKYEIFER